MDQQKNFAIFEIHERDVLIEAPCSGVSVSLSVTMIKVVYLQTLYLWVSARRLSGQNISLAFRVNYQSFFFASPLRKSTSITGSPSGPRTLFQTVLVDTM